jgi:pseudouridine synthase
MPSETKREIPRARPPQGRPRPFPHACASYDAARTTSNRQTPPRVTATASADDAPRLQLVLAQAGLASRRHAAEMIRAGRVRVNGKVAREPGCHVNLAQDQILVDNKPLPAPGRRRTILMNKPIGLLCSADGAQGKTVCDLIAGLPERLVPVGRLDRDSGGLLLLSNDGALIANLTHPRYGHRKIYRVEVTGPCNAATLARLREPMEIDGYTLRPVQVILLRKQGGHTWVRFVLHEGRNRQIRRMCAQVGLNIISLVRIAVDNLMLPEELAPGQWRDLAPHEIKALMTQQEPRPDTAPDAGQTPASDRPARRS